MRASLVGPVGLVLALCPALAASPKPPVARTSSDPPAAAPATSTALVIRGASLLDGTGKPPLANACVVVENGRIAAVGRLGSGRVPPGARVLTAPKGSTVLPGFIDMHVHASVRRGLMPYFLANGITSVRDLGCAEDRLEELKRYRSEVEDGRALGPRLFLAGPPLDGFPRAANWFPGPGARDAAGAVDGVRRLAEQGVDLIKLYRRLRPDVARTAIQEAHRRGLRVTWDYQWNYRYLASAIESGVDGLEHVYYSERSSRDEYQQLAEQIGASKLWFEPTLVAFRPPDETVTGDPDFARLPRSLTGFWRGLFWPMETDTEFAQMKTFVRLVHGQGGRFLAGTDTPVKYVAPGYGFHRELQFLAECRLTPMEVIQAATRNAAQALGREGELGTVEKGKRADLVVLAADPLKDIRATRRILWVIQGGRVHEPAKLEKQALASAPADDTRVPPYVHGQ